MLLTRGTGDISMKSLTTLAVPENKPLMWQGSVGKDLQHLEKDRAIHTDPDETRRRRTIKLDRNNNTLGFALQTYGIKNKKTNELEVMTYVDYVEFNGPAGLAGMRKGDVILSVNGENVEGIPHKLLVKKIQESSGTSLRLVVLFEDCCRKVELYERFIKLKQILKMKLEEYRTLEKKEHYILEGHGGFSRMSSVRSSLRSSSSSDWDRFSMVVSPAQMLQSMPRGGAQHFLFPRAYPSSVDTCSELSLNDVALNDSFSDDSDAFLSASCSDISIQGLKKNKMNSLSNQSVSSLITRAEGGAHHENVSRDFKDEKIENSAGVKVVFSLDGEEVDVRSAEYAKTDLDTKQIDQKTEETNSDTKETDQDTEQTDVEDSKSNEILNEGDQNGSKTLNDEPSSTGSNENNSLSDHSQMISVPVEDPVSKDSDEMLQGDITTTNEGGDIGGDNSPSTQVDNSCTPKGDHIQTNEDKSTKTKGDDSDTSKGDNPTTTTGGNSDLTRVDKPNIKVDDVISEKGDNSESAISPQGDNLTPPKGDNFSPTKGDNSSTSTPPKTTKRFVKGVRVNDFNQITKL